jgi:N-acetylglutamate synthase-like GNAT family acetyltransferase
MRGSNGNGRSPRNVGQKGNPALLTVRSAGLPDLVPLTFFIDAVLRKDYFLRRGQLESMLRDRYHEILIAELDTVLVGVAITTRGTHLVNLLVHPAYRKLGIGRCLIERSGAQSVSVKLDMSSGNPRAFYEALGFESTGQRNRKGNIESMRLVARPRGGPDAKGHASTAAQQKPVDKRTPANAGSAA